MNMFAKVLLMVAVPPVLLGAGAYAFLEYSGGQEDGSAPPLRPLSINTARKTAKGGCCCAAKGKSCDCGPNCGSHKVAAAQPTSAAQAVGLLGSPMGPLTAPALFVVTPPPAKVGSAAPAARSTPTP